MNSVVTDTPGRLFLSYASQDRADVYAWRGDKDRAFEWLARARAQNDSGLIYVKYDPLLRKLRDDPRFEQWLRESNLE
jgi:serine/threonine-protein kinase